MILKELIDFLKDFPEEYELKFTTPDQSQDRNTNELKWLCLDYLDADIDQNTEQVVFSMYSMNQLEVNDENN